MDKFRSLGWKLQSSLFGRAHEILGEQQTIMAGQSFL
jgi:hypothetical protein